MSIIIKGMEMPTSCWYCPCHHRKIDDSYYDYEICGASGTVFNDGYSSVTGHKVHIDPFKERLDNCPLVSVPPHGRLIDADALKASLVFAEETAEWAFPALRAVLMVVDEMPTIIPAEEGET